MELALSREMLGRTFNGSGQPIDGLGEIYAEKSADINGQPLNRYHVYIQETILIPVFPVLMP